MIETQSVEAQTPIVLSKAGQLARRAVARRALVVGAVVFAFAAVGCDNAAAEQNKANAAQKQADEKIAEASKEADVKMKSAQAEADKKIADAQAGFTKLREDFRHSTVLNLADLDKKIADLTAKATTETGKSKTDLDAKLKLIVPSRDAFVADYKSIETASATTWDATKARLDKEWTELKSSVDKA
jgi:regulator of protease activity HflC (stomatin/prohibitin superfamily)